MCKTIGWILRNFTPRALWYFHSIEGGNSEKFANKGRVAVPKRMNFRKSSRGGEVISILKICNADFGPLTRAFHTGVSGNNGIQVSEIEGVKGRFEYFRKLIRFGTATRPYYYK